jgi:ubiquinone/menaquinone biosynthesis C-methylase UbiE
MQPFNAERFKAAERDSYSRAAAYWDTVEAQRMADRYGARLFTLAHLAPGQTVLDVACGVGELTIRAARIVGPHGRAIGVDIAPGMIATAIARAQRLLPDNPELRPQFSEMDAEALSFPDSSFDAVLCQFGLIHFPHGDRALAEMHRVLRPGGRVALAMQGDPRYARSSALFPEALAAVAPELAASVPSYFTYGPPGALDAALTAAGFTDIHVEHHNTEEIIRDGEQLWQSLISASGKAQMLLAALPPAQARQLHAAFLQRLETYRRGDVLVIPQQTVYGTGKRQPPGTGPQQQSERQALDRGISR